MSTLDVWPSATIDFPLQLYSAILSNPNWPPLYFTPAPSIHSPWRNKLPSPGEWAPDHVDRHNPSSLTQDGGGGGVLALWVDYQLHIFFEGGVEVCVCVWGGGGVQ